MTDEGAYLDVLTNVIGEETLRAKYNQSAEVGHLRQMGFSQAGFFPLDFPIDLN